MSDSSIPPACVGCGRPILDDETVVRLSAGVVRREGFSHLLMRPDVFVHAGSGVDPSTGARERWCLGRHAVERATALLRIHGTTGASGRE